VGGGDPTSPPSPRATLTFSAAALRVSSAQRRRRGGAAVRLRVSCPRERYGTPATKKRRRRERSPVAVRASTRSTCSADARAGAAGSACSSASSPPLEGSGAGQRALRLGCRADASPPPPPPGSALTRERRSGSMGALHARGAARRGARAGCCAPRGLGSKRARTVAAEQQEKEGGPLQRLAQQSSSRSR